MTQLLEEAVANLPSELLSALAHRARLRETDQAHQQCSDKTGILLAGPPSCPPPQPWRPWTELDLLDAAVAMSEDPWWTYQRAAWALESAVRHSNLPLRTLAAALEVVAA